MTRPSRPIQASRLHGARWVQQTDGETAWTSLASPDMRYGWVELLPSFGSSTNRWHATLTSQLVDLTDCVDGHVRVGQVFRTKRQAMRYLEIVAIAAWRRVLIAAARKVAKMKAQDVEAEALAARSPGVYVAIANPALYPVLMTEATAAEVGS